MTSIAVEGLGKRYVLGVPKSATWWRSRRTVGRGAAVGAPSRREVWALRDVSFRLREGSILGIVGANGAGKTTLLKILARVTPPTVGCVRGRGRVLPLLEIRGGLHPFLTGRQNVLLSAAMYGVTKREAERCLDAIVDFAGIGEFIDAPLRAYSSGMHLRLAFSIALNLEPRILLADEVLAVGDAAFQERCLLGVQAAARAGTTVLLVSHDLSALSRLCDRGLWLDEGVVVASGGATEVIEGYANGVAPGAAERSRESDAKVGQNRLGEILGIRLLAPDGREIATVSAHERLGIQIRFRSERAGIAAVCGVIVRTEGVVAFRSFQRKPVALSEPGVHVAEAWIPARVLAGRAYTVRVQVRLGECADGDAGWKERSRLVADPAVSFQVDDPASRGAVLDKRPGIVGPELDWSTRREVDARGA